MSICPPIDGFDHRREKLECRVGHSNVKHYKSKTTTEIVEFDGPHLLPAIPGWQEVADHALDWALKHAEPTG